MHLPRNEKLKENSRQLRRKATKEENHLWYDFLRTYPRQFHRQRVIKNYIVDFYCPAIKLAIELDGSQHYEEKGQYGDCQRTDDLNRLGVTVLRFSNLDVSKNFEGVCIAIEQKVNELRDR